MPLRVERDRHRTRGGHGLVGVGGRVDTRWFVERLADCRMSQRGLARLMNLDPSAVSLMLRGKRRMTASEAAEIARFLGVPPEEVLLRAGSTGTIPLAQAAGGTRIAQEARSGREGGVAHPGAEDGAGGLSEARTVKGSVVRGSEVEGGTGARPPEGAGLAGARPPEGAEKCAGFLALPVHLSDGSVARVVIPKILKKADADRIVALLTAFVGE